MPDGQPSGRYVEQATTGELVRAFVPDPLPPPKEDLGITDEDWARHDKALLVLGRLDTATWLLPDPSLFLDFYVRKEAVLSSQIEGTQSSLSDLLLFESEEEPDTSLEDLRETSNYVKALNHGIENVKRADGLPIVGRLIREMHSILLKSGRGSTKQPGEFRSSQNWIGGTRPGNARYVPPPPDLVPKCMSELEIFINQPHDSTRPLLKAALAHVQFESIHPFLDGNGRVGRLLIPLILCAGRLLREPILYLSLFFKQHRDEYYERLQAVRTKSEWAEWIRFFFEAIEVTATDEIQSIIRIRTLFENDEKRIEKTPAITRRVYKHLQRHAIIASVPRTAKVLSVSQPSIRDAMERLEELGIVAPLTEKRRGRSYAYRQYLSLLSEGTESRW